MRSKVVNAKALFAGFLLAVVSSPLVPETARAETVSKSTIQIVEPWSKQTPTGARVAGGYLSITNSGAKPDRLIGGTIANAARVEIHEMSMTGGMMQMRELPTGIEIMPGATVSLEPGGLHLMFMEVTSPARAGDTIKGTLVFETAGTVEVTFSVTPMGASGPEGHTSHDAHAAKPASGTGQHQHTK